MENRVDAKETSIPSDVIGGVEKLVASSENKYGCGGLSHGSLTSINGFVGRLCIRELRDGQNFAGIKEVGGQDDQEVCIEGSTSTAYPTELVDKCEAGNELGVNRIAIGAVSEQVDLHDLNVEEEDLSVRGSVPPDGESMH